MMDWQPGDVALCVDDRGPYQEPGETMGLVLGGTYTVMAVILNEIGGIDPDGKEAPCTILRLLELNNYWDWEHGAFAASRFRKQPPLIKETEEEKEAAL